MNVARFTPPAFRGYQPAWLRGDVVAGLTLAAVAIPETTGYPSIAQLPVVTGLYTVIFPTLPFALLGSSTLLVVGADSATAAILSAGLAGLGIAGQIPDMLGIPKGTGSWFQQQWWTITHVLEANLPTAAFAAGTLVVILGFKKSCRRCSARSSR